ncbi:helix-turn-helix domain-containing protein [Enterococcus sp. UD-01]|jgi:transposase-like protein|uniref:helix-turn-helix domain-containing protein n=1 Tax=Enterococcus sp. UD-01 TaxID=3373911 RepID=UPI003832BE1B
MAKHNYYPDTLKIQIVERLLKGESASSLREEFNIPGRGTIYNWKKWYLSGEFHRLKASSGRPSEQELSLSKVLEEKEKELELIKKFFSKERW